MISKIKKPVSILLSVIMVFSLFTIVPITASAAVGDVLPESEYLTFTAEEAGSTVTLNVDTGNNFQYDLNGTGLTGYTPGTTITLANAGDYVRFCGTGTTFDYSNSKRVSLTGKVACSGNVMSLRLDYDGKVQGLEDYCFFCMFYGCTGLTSAPELPETELKRYCYSYMFSGCTNLTKAPELPATNLAESCYDNMFDGCTSLTELPALPATTLAESCYSYMFNGCTSLTELPALPATTLQSSCYYGMFSGCKNIRISDEAGTFDDITYSVEYRIPTTGEGTSATNALKRMFTSTGGKFKGTPSINTTYYLPATAPTYTVTWKNGDTTLETDTDVAEGTTPTYDGTTPEKASDTYYDYTFFGWSDGSNTYAADALPAVSGDVTYTAQYTATAKTFKAYAKKLTGETYTIENLTGETTVAQLKEIIADQIDIPATAQRLIFAGKQLDDEKTLAEYNIGEESTFHLIIRGYTVTWLNYDNSELGTTTVQYGATPTYDGATPTQPEDAQNTYTFAGWKNGETTYAPDALPAVSGDVTYTAVYTADPKIPAPQLPDVIKDCTYYNSYYGVYANVPFAEMFNDIQNGALVFDSYSDTEKCIMDTKDYSYKFYDQAGTELQAENVCHDDSADGYGYRVIMNIFEFSNPISGPLYIVATAPAPATFKVYVKKLTGETYTIENLTGETTVAQLKEIIADQIDIPATAQRLIFAGKQLDDAKTLAEYNIEEESTIHLVIRGYTVTWKNWNGDVLETDENVEAGTLPKYDGATPVRPEDMNATYTFAAWDDGKTTYLIGIDQLPPVTGDVTYKAEYTADIKKLFVTHSVTLGGDIGVNFYIDSNVAGVKDADTAVVKFAWDGGKYIKEVNLKELTPNAKGWLKATVNVVAAQMAHTIEATAFINGNMFYTVDLFSVQDYAEAVYAEPEKYDPEKPEQLKALAKALLNYGSEAQTVFADALQEHPDRADKIVGQSDYSGVTAAAVAAKINGAASDLDEIASQLDAEFYTSSLIYLQNNTLRLYFTPESKTIGALDGKGFAGALSEYYYYADHANIPAAELDNQQTFNVNGVEFTYSPLDYVVAVLNSNSMNDTQKNLAKALFLYNQAANAYFD